MAPPTAKNPPVAAPAEPLEPEYDFDNWSEEDEKIAIAALVPDIKYIIVERNFVGRFPDGVIVKVPLSISLDDVDAFTAGESPVDQFKTLLRTVAGDEVAAQFSSHDLSETIVMSEKFFKTLNRIAGATVPE